MEDPSSPSTPPSQFPHAHPAPKKGLGTGAKVGIGCGVIAILVVIGIIIASVMLGGKVMKFADEAQKNPTRATATMMVTVSGGNMTMVAEDDANKRYTVKDTKSGTLTTIYWSEAKKAPEVIPGDFSAIPTPPAAGTGTDSTPSPEAKE
ncbi:MAG TPA: hypothetical protein VF258_03985 [Luteolibacter sp.]